MTMDEVIEIMADKIAQMEGFYRVNSLAERNNNPGNLRSWGKNPIVSGYAKFATKEQGWVALKRQIKLNILRDLTFLEFFSGKDKVYSGYAPAADKNDPTNYAKFVAKPFKVSENTVIKDLIDA